MPKTARIDEIEIDGEFVQIYFDDGDVEPRLTIDDPPIKYMQQSELLNMRNIPTTEYSQEPDSRTNMQLYIDDILTNFNNRSVAQLGIAQDTIDELGGYNNGKLEFDDNAIEGLLQITIEWLEIINSNFNDLLGLVSVNNFLLGTMGITGISKEYVTKSQLEEITNGYTQLINDKTKPDPVDVSLTAIAAGGLAGEMVKPLAKVGIKLIPLPLQIVGAMGYVMYKYRPETPPDGKTLPNYLTGEVAPNGYITNENKNDTSTIMPQSTNQQFTENINDLVPTILVKDNNFQIMTTQQQLAPWTETAFNSSSQSTLEMLGFNDNGYQTNQTQDISNLLGVDGDENAFSRVFSTVMLSNANEMQEQGTMDLVNAINETEEFLKTFNEVIENTPTSDLLEIYTALHNPNSDETDKWETVYKKDNIYDNSNVQTKQMLHTDTYESKTNTNTVTMEDLKSSMNNLTNFIPPTVENTYDMPITNYITVKVENENDYDEITRQVVIRMTSGLHSAAAAVGMTKAY